MNGAAVVASIDDRSMTSLKARRCRSLA